MNAFFQYLYSAACCVFFLSTKTSSPSKPDSTTGADANSISNSDTSSVAGSSDTSSVAASSDANSVTDSDISSVTGSDISSTASSDTSSTAGSDTSSTVSSGTSSTAGSDPSSSNISESPNFLKNAVQTAISDFTKGATSSLEPFVGPEIAATIVTIGLLVCAFGTLYAIGVAILNILPEPPKPDLSNEKPADLTGSIKDSDESIISSSILDPLNDVSKPTLPEEIEAFFEPYLGAEMAETARICIFYTGFTYSLSFLIFIIFFYKGSIILSRLNLKKEEVEPKK